MIVELDMLSKTPIYQQIMDKIIEAIVKGELKNGDSLPSVRQLAGELGINMHTVNKAYNILKREGYVSVHQRKGVVVTGKAKADTEYGEDLYLRLRTLLIEGYSKGIPAKRLLESCRCVLQELEGEGEKQG